MSASPTLSLFPSQSAEGAAFAAAVAGMAEAKGYAVRAPEGLLALERSCLTDTAVVVDASIDAPSEIYRQSALPPTLFEHVLVAGRTYLPLNFRSRSVCAPRYPHRYAKEELLQWLDGRLDALLRNPGWRMPPDEALDPKMLGVALRKLAENTTETRRDGGVFISYRARYDYHAARALAARIGAGELPGAAWVRMLEPGELTTEREILSEGRSWMVLTLLDEALSDCDELWICHTPHYLGSWWTIAEVFLAACLRKRVRMYDPATKTVSEPPPEYRPAISDATLDRFSTLTHYCPVKSRCECRNCR